MQTIHAVISLLIPLAILAGIIWLVLWTRGAGERRRKRMLDDLAQTMTAALKKTDWVIVDTETTGLRDRDVVISIAVIDPSERVLLDTYVQLPARKRISEKAQAKHGITREALKDAPSWADVRLKLDQIVSGKECVAYNAPYDARMVEQTDRAHGVTGKPIKWVDIMPLHNQFVGEWDHYRNKTKWQKLPGADHSAVGDCRAALAVMRRMARLPPVSANRRA